MQKSDYTEALHYYGVVIYGSPCGRPEKVCFFSSLISSKKNWFSSELMTNSQPVRNVESFKFFLELLRKE